MTQVPPAAPREEALPGDLQVRDALAADAPAIAALLGQLGSPATAGQARARLRAFLSRAPAAVLVGTLGGRVIALAAVLVYWPLQRPRPSALISALVVERNLRRRGIGRGMLDAVGRFAREQGCERLVVGSAARRRAAHAFYRGCGWADHGRRFVATLA